MPKVIYKKEEAKGVVPKKEYARDYIVTDVISPDLCGAKNFRMGFVSIPPKSGGAIHRHSGEQAWYILKGEGYQYVDGEKHFCKAGDFMYVPANAAHQTVNTGNETWEAIFVTAPPYEISEIEVLEPFKKKHLTE